MLNIQTLKREWFSNVRADLLAGTVVALALIPESIAFSIIAGVDPKVGLYASFIIAIVTSIFGGRPGLISAATGAMALVMVSLVKDHGLQYLFAAGILTGVIQLVIGWLKLGRQLKYIPHAVMVGFVNGLAILVFMAQLPQLTNVPVAVYGMVAFALAVMFILPRFTRLVPSPLVSIVIITAAAILGGIQVPTVGDMGALPTTLPPFTLPQVPLNLDTLRIILPYSLTLAVVGLLESLLTATLLDDMTDTPSDKNREARGQGIANIVANLFGGMAGCALIGQSVINVRSGGRGRLSTFTAGAFLLFFILVLGDWVGRIPMAALVAVLIMMCLTTFNWSSLTQIRKIPRSETAAMVTTVAAIVLTHNLAIGVVFGIALSALFFSRKVAKVVMVEKTLSADGTHHTYRVAGQIFFVAVHGWLDQFDFHHEQPAQKVTLDFSQAHIWDQAAVGSIDQIVTKFRRVGAEVEIVGMNEASASLVNRLTTHNDPRSLSKAAGH